MTLHLKCTRSRLIVSFFTCLSMTALSGCGGLSDDLTDSIVKTNYGNKRKLSPLITKIDPILEPMVEEFLNEPFCDTATGGIDCRARMSLLSEINFDSTKINQVTSEQNSATLGICLGALSLGGMKRTAGGGYVKPAFRTGSVHLKDSLRTEMFDLIRALVYHELGHCIFYKLHYPASSGIHLMNPIQMDSEFIVYSWAWVLANFQSYLLSSYGVGYSFAPKSAESDDTASDANELFDLKAGTFPVVNLQGKIMRQFCTQNH